MGTSVSKFRLGVATILHKKKPNNCETRPGVFYKCPGAPGTERNPMLDREHEPQHGEYRTCRRTIHAQLAQGLLSGKQNSQQMLILALCVCACSNTGGVAEKCVQRRQKRAEQ